MAITIRSAKRKKKFVKTKIVATIGPSSTTEKILLKMVKAGMSVARLNFSHGDYDHHVKVIEKIRKISAQEDIPVAILQDLCGPKIRLGQSGPSQACVVQHEPERPQNQAGRTPGAGSLEEKRNY